MRPRPYPLIVDRQGAKDPKKILHTRPLAFLASWRSVSLGLLVATACVETAPDYIDVGQYGTLLDRVPRLPGSGDAMEAARPVASTGFRTGPQRVNVRVDQAVTAALQGTFFGGSPDPGATFTFSCTGDPVEVKFVTTARQGYPGPGFHVRIAGGEPALVEVSERKLRVQRLPVPRGVCVDADGTFLLTMELEKADRRVLMGEPIVRRRASTRRTPIILISIDTLRADYWDHARPRPDALAAFRDSAIVFERAFSAAPTTHPAHRVMLSGHSLERTLKGPIDQSVSMVPALRRAGYRTVAFVAGGFVRAPFGFGFGMPPTDRHRIGGFAIGFDLYLEGMDPGAGLPKGKARQGLDVFEQEDRIESYTLAPSLERSLKWFVQNSGEAAFHFLHGYDTHEYRSVGTPAWRRAADELPDADQTQLTPCIERLGVKIGARWAIHHPRTTAPRLRKLGKSEGCHRLTLRVFYRARVIETERLIDTYLGGLRRLGIYDDALIVITSDHGESLLDEESLKEERVYWGHNRLTFRNQHVPLWIKPPGAHGGRTVSTPVGLVDLRAILAGLTGLPLGPSVGVDVLAGEQRVRPIEMADLWRAGTVLPDGSLCTWSAGDDALPLRRTLEGPWLEVSGEAAARCEAARRIIAAPESLGDSAHVPDELRDELRALGYLED